jgi:hypothetical protein
MNPVIRKRKIAPVLRQWLSIATTKTHSTVPIPDKLVSIVDNPEIINRIPLEGKSL